MIPWPIAIYAPARGSRPPLPSVAAVMGPGAMTPDIEIIIVPARKEASPMSFSVYTDKIVQYPIRGGVYHDGRCIVKRK